MSTLQGLPPGLFEFFADLKEDNSKAFWQTNRDRWERDVRAPMQSLLGELSNEFGPLRMFRLNRDVRFSQDKSPYKLWTGATSESNAVGGIGYYLEASATGIITGYGAMLMNPDQLHRFRAAIDDEASGAAFRQVNDTLASLLLPVSHGAGEPLKTAPRGFAIDHPRIGYLRWKGAVVVREWATADWMHTPRLLESIRDVWLGAAPLKTWLDTYVADRRPV